MPKYLVERNAPEASSLSADDLSQAARTSCGVLREMGPGIQWLQSFVAEGKIVCVYIAPNEEAIREHARRGGFACDAVREIHDVIDPTTAE